MAAALWALLPRLLLGAVMAEGSPNGATRPPRQQDMRAVLRHRLERFHEGAWLELLEEGRAGDNAGLLLRGVGKDESQRGQVLAAPGSIKPHTKFKAEVYVLTKEEGGRHTPFFNGYRPQFFFRTTDVTGATQLPEGVEMVMPGDNVQMEVELIMPIAMDPELRFAIREGGRTVGAGVVTEIIE